MKLDRESPTNKSKADYKARASFFPKKQESVRTGIEKSSSNSLLNFTVNKCIYNKVIEIEQLNKTTHRVGKLLESEVSDILRSLQPSRPSRRTCIRRRKSARTSLCWFQSDYTLASAPQDQTLSISGIKAWTIAFWISKSLWSSIRSQRRPSLLLSLRCLRARGPKGNSDFLTFLFKKNLHSKRRKHRSQRIDRNKDKRGYYNNMRYLIKSSNTPMQQSGNSFVNSPISSKDSWNDLSAERPNTVMGSRYMPQSRRLYSSKLYYKMQYLMNNEKSKDFQMQSEYVLK